MTPPGGFLTGTGSFTTGDLALLIVVLVLLAASAVLALAETGLVRMTPPAACSGNVSS